MAHVGKTYPFFYFRDYSSPVSGFAKRLAWRYTAFCGIAPPGPFSTWANKHVISKEPYFADGKTKVIYDTDPPTGSDPDWFLRLEYKLDFTANFCAITSYGMKGTAIGIKQPMSFFATTLDDIFESGTRQVFSPPWNPVTPSFGLLARWHGSTWTELGVTEYPGFPIS